MRIDQLNLVQGAVEGQVVVVTGGGRGIGLEVVRAFARLGARVVIAELADSGQSAEDEVHRAGGQACFVRTDVSDAESVTALARQADQRFGPVDILVNNAIYIPLAPVSELAVEDWDRTMAVNLRGTFLTCKAFLPQMIERRSGTIINMVSTDAMPGLAAYIASKQGIVGFSQTLAGEVGSLGVRVIPFGPGMVDTPGIRSVAERLAPRLGLTHEQFLGLSLHPAYDGLMPAEDAAAATVYLAVKLAGEFHGQVVTGYEVLERAGLIQRTSVPEVAAGAAPQAAPAGGGAALSGAKALKAILEQTEAEFGKLPIFARPMARNGFKSKAGLSLADWNRQAGELAERLEQAGSGQPDPAALKAAAARVQSGLGRLVEYFRGVPGETARFSRDQSLLQEVARLSAERIGTIESLGEALKRET
jgi:NAD(P)-dependent dehydrogenase (short-subunit alcohol dehydrogenase family)